MASLFPPEAVIGTEFRAEELSCLTPRHFDLAAASPHVYLSVGETKNGRAVEQPLPPDVAAELRAFLAEKPEGGPVWPGASAMQTGVRSGRRCPVQVASSTGRQGSSATLPARARAVAYHPASTGYEFASSVQ